jgi:hypothetical protein
MRLRSGAAIEYVWQLDAVRPFMGLRAAASGSHWRAKAMMYSSRSSCTPAVRDRPI